MRKLLFPSILLLAAVICLNFTKTHIENSQTVNPVIGDISFVSKFGYLPDANTSEILRIKTHLEYVEDLLRNKEVSGFTAEQLQRRSHLLDLLHQYREAGVFPHFSLFGHDNGKQ